MKLILAIVQSEDADLLLEALCRLEQRATRINTVGSFLDVPNVTVLIAANDNKIDDILATIHQQCHPRRHYINAAPDRAELPGMIGSAVVAPLEVVVGGATVFVFKLRRFIRLGPPTPLVNSPAEVVKPEDQSKGRKETTMQLILAIVQNEDADPVIEALMAAEYRLTRINTAGGFLKRGNATLLIGVERERVDDVIGIIQRNCRRRDQATPLRQGIPMYSATVFVLDAERFERL